MTIGDEVLERVAFSQDTLLAGHTKSVSRRAATSSSRLFHLAFQTLAVAFQKLSPFGAADGAHEAGEGDVGDVAGFARGMREAQAAFAGGAVALFVVALEARTDDVLPRGFAAATAREDVVERQRLARAAVNAGVAVAGQNAFARDFQFRRRTANARMQAQNRRNEMLFVGAAHRLLGKAQHFGFVEQKQRDAAMKRADVERLEVLVQDQNAGELSRVGLDGGACAFAAAQVALRGAVGIGFAAPTNLRRGRML